MTRRVAVRRSAYNLGAGYRYYSFQIMATAPTTTFPQKLHEIISDEANKDIICWVNNGAAFKVLDSDAFEANIVRKHFRRKFKFAVLLVIRPILSVLMCLFHILSL